MGHPQDEKTTYGPVVSANHRAKVLSYIEHGKNDDKAKVLYEGKQQFPTK